MRCSKIIQKKTKGSFMHKCLNEKLVVNAITRQRSHFSDDISVYLACWEVFLQLVVANLQK